MKSTLDKPLLIIGTLLFISVAAFLAGVIQYPYGWMVLLMFLIARILQLRQPTKRIGRSQLPPSGKKGRVRVKNR